MYEHLRPRFSRAAKRVLRSPANALVASSDTLAARIRMGATRSIGNMPAVAAKFAPYEEGMTSFVLRATAAEQGDDGLPIPPAEVLRQGYPDTAEEYITSGQEHVGAMFDVLREAGRPLEAGERVLEFGCAAGRAIRHLYTAAESGEVWGVDIRTDQIMWCQQHLSPPFHFFTSTTFPHLAFEDNYFDLVYATSLFSDFFELTDFWLLELRRILRQNGRLYLTILDKHSIALIMAFAEEHPLSWLKKAVIECDRRSPFVGSDFDVVSINCLPSAAYTFYDLDHLARKFENLGFRILGVREEAQWFLTGVVIAPA